MKKNTLIICIVAAVLVVGLVIGLILVLGGDNNPTPGPQGPAEKTYTLSIVVDEGLGSVNAKGESTAIALALVYDADGKIVAARFDSVQPKFAFNTDKTDIVAVSRVETKVEQGEKYGGTEAAADYLKMPAGSWEKQAKAFENFIVGKTAAEVAALDTSAENVQAGNIVAGCTMTSSTPVFQKLVAEAFAYTRNVTFKTTAPKTDIKLGLAVDTKVSGSVEKGATIAADFAAVAIVDGKVKAAMLDSAEAKYTLAIAEEKLTATLKEYKGTKNEQGDAYDVNDYVTPMPSGRWYAQAQAYADTTKGKTAAELNDLSTDKIEGSCSIYTGGYKAALVRAAGYAR